MDFGWRRPDHRDGDGQLKPEHEHYTRLPQDCGLTSLAPSQDDAPLRRLAEIVESSDDAIISMDESGVITSWNPGAQRLFGYSAGEVMGQSIMLLWPPEHRDDEGAILAKIRRGERISHYETLRQAKDGSLLNISLTVSPLRDAAGAIVGMSKIARDITARLRAQQLLETQRRRLEMLERVSKLIARDLDLDRIVQTVTDAATELSGAKFGAFFYNVLNDKGESYLLYTLSGAPRSAFESFGMPRNTAVFDHTFKGAGVVRSHDIRQDPRYGRNPPYHGMPAGHLPVISYLAVPVIGHEGEVLGGLFFGHDQPGRFDQEAEDNVVGIAGHAAIAINNARLLKAAQNEVARRREAEEAKELLLHELQHRVRNTLGVVQALARQTFKSAPKPERDSFLARIEALAGAHGLLTTNQWDSASIAEVVERGLRVFRDRQDRFAVKGPLVQLPANKALSLAMVLHELGTNAVKYGALSNSDGRVTLTWSLPDDKPGCVHIVWQESGGPTVVPPSHKGFGSSLISKALVADGGSAELRYEPAGLCCSFDICLKDASAD
jgi:PAS domain S-box-containing protein